MGSTEVSEVKIRSDLIDSRVERRNIRVIQPNMGVWLTANSYSVADEPFRIDPTVVANDDEGAVLDGAHLCQPSGGRPYHGPLSHGPLSHAEKNHLGNVHTQQCQHD